MPTRFDVLWLTPRFTKRLEEQLRGNPPLRGRMQRLLQHYFDDTSPLHRTPIYGVNGRKIFHTRVTDDLRLVDEPLEPKRPNEVALLYVDRHDPANRWAERYCGDTLSEVERGLKLRSFGGAPPASDEAPSRAADAEPRFAREGTYGELLSRRELEALGVPRALVATVCVTHTSVELTLVGLPTEVSDRVLEAYLARCPSEPLVAPLPGPEEPAPVALRREQLPALLRLPLQRFLAQLTPEQQRLADRASRRLHVVKGAAGSGKTVVGIRRIANLCQQRDLFDKPILFTCYNQVLVHAVRQLVEETAGASCAALGVEVGTIYSVLGKARQRFGVPNLARLASPDAILPLVGQARGRVEGAGASGIPLRDAELLAEIIEVILGRVIESEEVYADPQKTVRRGRGTRLDEVARRGVWRVFLELAQECKRRGRYPYEWLPARLAARLPAEHADYPLYKAIVVDEVQDIPPSALKALVRLQGGRDDDILVLGDAGQNVYRRGFRWDQTGLSVSGGQVSVLRKCFRSTPTIVRAARRLLEQQREELGDDLVLPEESGEPGPSVVLHLHPSAEHERIGVALEVSELLVQGVAPSAVAVMVDDPQELSAIHQQLAQLELPCEHYNKNGAKRIDVNAPTIKLITTRSAKGLEFQVLFLVGLTEERFPAGPEDPDLADRARRTLYTAMMRCAWELHLSAPKGEATALLAELDPACVVRREEG